jgi:hypothetical protein
MRVQPFFSGNSFDVSLLELGQFEDLYYATCAKLKELSSGVDLLLTNGFKNPRDTYFTYKVANLARLGPINITDFRNCLAIHETFLYSQELKELLESGIKKMTIRERKYDARKASSTQDGIVPDYCMFTKFSFPMPVPSPRTASDEEFDSEEEPMGLDDDEEGDVNNIPYFHPGIWGKHEARIRNQQRYLKNKQIWLKDIKGLQDMTNMSCGMIFGMLAEKYRPIVGISIGRLGTPEAPELTPCTGTFEPVPAYVSPYNLEERAKKLNNPDGPEKPCICDPDCLCAPLCASDPTQNCLCEDNALFARVTEGMDIDDLDVPDLVRRKRQASESSGSRTASVATMGEASAKVHAEDAASEDAKSDVAYSLNSHFTMDRISELINQERHYQHEREMEAGTSNMDAMSLFDDAAIAGTIESNAPIEGTYDEDFYLYSSDSFVPPVRMSSLVYQELLRQPFSKMCPHPPKRISLAERFFGSTSKAQKNTPKDKKPKNSTSGNPSKVSKQITKRSLADVGFLNLKNALRRDSQPHGGFSNKY